MTMDDFNGFASEFRRLFATFGGFKGSPADMDARIDGYFHALKQLPLRLVSEKADTWLQTQAKMPKPAEWAAVVVVTAIPLEALSPADAAAYLDAERVCWESDPCGCEPCLTAGVAEKALRFVPETTSDERDSNALLGGRVVTRGHWAHGWELFRWYEARANYYNARIERFGMPRDPEVRKRSGLFTKLTQVTSQEMP